MVLVSAPVADSSGVGAKAPDFIAKDLVSKKDLKLSELKGQVVLIYVWREVCPLCLDETKAFDEAVRRFRPGGVRSLIVIEQGNEPEIEMEAEIYRPVSAMINDPKGEFGRLYGINAYPVFLVVDVGGILRYRGSLLQGSALTGLLERLMAERGR